MKFYETKKKVFAVLSLMVAAQGYCSISDDLLKYEVSDSEARTVTATGLTATPEDSVLRIPETTVIDGLEYTVTGINMTLNMYNGGRNVSHVVVPKTVTLIENLKLPNASRNPYCIIEFAEGSGLRTVGREAFASNYASSG